MRTRPRWLSWVAGLLLLGTTAQAQQPDLSAHELIPAPKAQEQWSLFDSVLTEEVPLTRWHTDVDFAVMFNSAIQCNWGLYAASMDSPVFLSSRGFLGYRLDDGSAFRFTYRNLTQVGGTNGDTPYYTSRSGFTTNWFDLDFVSTEFALCDAIPMQLEFGGRFVCREMTHRTGSAFLRTDSTTTFYSGGPHLGWSSNCLLGETGWAIFSRIDTAITFGGGSTRWDYSFPTRSPDWLPLLPVAARNNYSALQFDLNVQLGMMRRWHLEHCDIGLGFGGQLDVLSLGDLGDGPGFDLVGLVNLGPYFRLEIGY